MKDKSPSEKDIESYKEQAMDVIYDSIDKSINSIAEFKFPFLTHYHGEEQLYRLKFLTEHLKDKCDKFIETIDENILATPK